jgi:hypothetical protein
VLLCNLAGIVISKDHAGGDKPRPYTCSKAQSAKRIAFGKE